MKFKAEIKNVQMNKLVSLDNEYKLTLITNDPTILELGKIPSDTIVDVEIKDE